MPPPDETTSPSGREFAGIAAVLLFLQAGLAAVSALGYIAMAAYARTPLSGGRAWPLLAPLVWLLLGLAVSTGGRWARRAAFAYEGLVVLLFLLERLLPGAKLTLITLVSALVLPTSVLVVLARGNTQPHSAPMPSLPPSAVRRARP